MLVALGLGAAIGASLLLGSALAAWREVPEEIAAAVTAFAGGALIAAVGLELVPSADEHAGAGLTALGLGVGALLFVAADWVLTREERQRDFRRAMHAAAARRLETRGKGESQVGFSLALGIFIDGVPETAALGLTIAEEQVGLALLTGIVVSNLTESYGASVFIVQGGRSRMIALGIFAGIAASLIAALLLGVTLLAEASGSVIGFSEALAAGAVLATVSITIIPPAFREVSWFTAIAAVAGFVVGYLLA
jgi:zinc transporter, ZIP family